MSIVQYDLFNNQETRLPFLKARKEYEWDRYVGLTDPGTVAEFINNTLQLRDRAEEYLYCLALNTKNHVLGVFEIGHGTVNASVIGYREIFVRVLLCGAVNLVLIHNHPSGDVAPSKEDISATKRIKEAGKMIGIRTLDHIIVGRSYYSFLENELI